MWKKNYEQIIRNPGEKQAAVQTNINLSINCSHTVDDWSFECFLTINSSYQNLYSIIFKKTPV